jgi:hypothetical protein
VVEFDEQIEDAPPFFESRLPVGSSASRIAGSFENARAMAIRYGNGFCFSP